MPIASRRWDKPDGLDCPRNGPEPIGAVDNRANAALNFLNRDPPDLEEVREAISRIGDAAERARELIGGIRDQVKKSPSRKDVFDLNRAIEEVLLLEASNAITKDAIAVQTEFAKAICPSFTATVSSCSKSCST